MTYDIYTHTRVEADTAAEAVAVVRAALASEGLTCGVASIHEVPAPENERERGGT